jgi:hypothetical protein
MALAATLMAVESRTSQPEASKGEPHRPAACGEGGGNSSALARARNLGVWWGPSRGERREPGRAAGATNGSTCLFSCNENTARRACPLPRPAGPHQLTHGGRVATSGTPVALISATNPPWARLGALPRTPARAFACIGSRPAHLAPPGPQGRTSLLRGEGGEVRAGETVANGRPSRLGLVRCASPAHPPARLPA